MPDIYHANHDSPYASQEEKSEITEMRGWLRDVFNFVPELTDTEVRRAVTRHYDGGIRQFRTDCKALWL